MTVPTLRIATCPRCRRPTATVDRIMICCRRVDDMLEVSPQEEAILRVLLYGALRPISVTELVESVWPYPDYSPELECQNVRVIISRMRKRLALIGLEIPSRGSGHYFSTGYVLRRACQTRDARSGHPRHRP